MRKLGILVLLVLFVSIGMVYAGDTMDCVGATVSTSAGIGAGIGLMVGGPVGAEIGLGLGAAVGVGIASQICGD